MTEDILTGKKLPLIEEFYSLQGEGFHTGKAAYFIRVGGCDIGCSWCDSKISWKAETHQLVDVDEIVNKAIQYPAKAVVITGGEPLTYNLDYLCGQLQKNGIETFIETSGAYSLSGNWNWICLSPKEQNPPLDDIYLLANELKVIIQTEDDFKWAEINKTKVNNNCILYLQPEWSHYKTMISKIVDYIKQNPEWKISLQSHKFMKIP